MLMYGQPGVLTFLFRDMTRKVFDRFSTSICLGINCLVLAYNIGSRHHIIWDYHLGILISERDQPSCPAEENTETPSGEV